MGPAPGRCMGRDRMGQDWVGWKALGTAHGEKPEDLNAGRLRPWASISFLNPWGAGPELGRSLRGQKGRKPQLCPRQPHLRGPGTQGTQIRCGRATPTMMTHRGACPETDSRRKGQVSLLGWWIHPLWHAQEKQHLRPR